MTLFHWCLDCSALIRFPPTVQPPISTPVLLKTWATARYTTHVQIYADLSCGGCGPVERIANPTPHSLLWHLLAQLCSFFGGHHLATPGNVHVIPFPDYYYLIISKLGTDS